MLGTGIEEINGIRFAVSAVYHVNASKPTSSISGEVVTGHLITQANKLGRIQGGDVAVDSTGNILVTVPDALIKIHPNTGVQTVIASGPHFSSPGSIALELNGDILVSMGNTIIRVNPATGEQTEVSRGGFLDCCDAAGIVVVP